MTGIILAEVWMCRRTSARLVGNDSFISRWTGDLLRFYQLPRASL